MQLLRPPCHGDTRRSASALRPRTAQRHMQIFTCQHSTPSLVRHCCSTAPTSNQRKGELTYIIRQFLHELAWNVCVPTISNYTIARSVFLLIVFPSFVRVTLHMPSVTWIQHQVDASKSAKVQSIRFCLYVTDYLACCITIKQLSPCSTHA